MTNQFIRLADDSTNTGKRLDTEELTVAALVVQRERMQIAGATDVQIASVLNAAPAGTEYALIVRNIPSGTQTVSGTVTANAGTGVFDITPVTPIATDYLPVRLTDATNFLGITANPLITRISDGVDLVTVTAGGRLQTEAIGTGVGGSFPILSGDWDTTRVSVRPSDGAVFYDLPVGQGSNAAIAARGVFIAGQFDDTTPTLPVEDQASAVRISAQRSLYVQLRSGTADFGTSGAPLRIDPTGTTTQPISGTVTSNQGTPAITANRWPVQITDGTDLALVSVAGALLVDSSAVTQPVSGTVNIGTFPDNEPFNLAQYGGVATTLGQKVMASSIPVVIANDQSGVLVNSINIDDAAFVVAIDPVWGFGALADEVTPDSVNEGDAGIVRMSLNRNLYTQIRDSTAERSAAVSAGNALRVQVAEQNKTILRANIDFTATGDNTIVAASVGNKTKVLAYSLVVGAATNLRWKSGASSISGLMNFGANMGISQPYPSTPDQNPLETAVNTALILNQSGTAQVGGYIVYYQEA